AQLAKASRSRAPAAIARLGAYWQLLGRLLPRSGNHRRTRDHRGSSWIEVSVHCPRRYSADLIIFFARAVDQATHAFLIFYSFQPYVFQQIGAHEMMADDAPPDVSLPRSRSRPRLQSRERPQPSPD